MLRIITYVGGGTTLTMPVTPESYKVTTPTVCCGYDKRTYGRGGYYHYRNAAGGTVEAETYLLPSKAYSFLSENSQAKPQVYIDTFLKWQKAGTAVQYIVSSEPQINIKCLIQMVEYGESGGFGNYTLTVTLRELPGSGRTETKTARCDQGRQTQGKKGRDAGFDRQVLLRRRDIEKRS